MNIVFVLPRFVKSQSGGYKMVYEYSNYLSNRGHNVSLLYLNENALKRYHLPERIRKIVINKMTDIGPKWFELDKSILKISTCKISYEEKLKNIDIVVFTAIETIEYVNFFKDIHKVYFIQDFENWNYTDEEVFSSYNLIMTKIVVARWLKELVDKHSNKPSFIVPNCINTNIFFDRELERERHSIVFHYRSANYKGAKYAIKVIEELHKRYKDLKVDVISTENKPGNLPQYCSFHHCINADEIAKINNKTQVFMCTSIEEGFGLPGLEAMACGCVLVSSSYKGVLEYAINNVNALLSPIKDVDFMVNNVVKLFEDDEFRYKLSKNGVKTGQERSVEKSAHLFEKILLHDV